MTIDTLDALDVLDARSNRRDLVAAVAAAVGFDLAVRSGVACLAGALLVAVVALGLAASGRLHNPQARAAAAAAPVFGFFLMWRDSPWLLLPDTAAAGMLLVVAASFARGSSVADVPGADIVTRGLRAVGHAFTAPAFLLDALPRPRRSGHWDAVVRGAVLAVPLVLVLGLLLSSADAVFASFFRVPLDPGSLTLHLVLATFGAWGMAALSRSAAVSTADPSTRVGYRLGTVESTVILGALVALYAGFAVSQLVVALDGADHVLRTAGLTYAEYARNGFFQLLAVAVLTLVVLPALDNGERMVRILSGAAVILTVLIVGVALRRLGLYQHAFGLTMLRLYGTVFAAWIGAVFVLLGCRLLGLGGERRWLLPAAVSMGLMMLLALNVANPEAVVVRHNTGFEKWDEWYLVSLSDDAVPALAREREPEIICHRPVPIRPRRTGWAGWNRSKQRADDLRAKVCPGRARP